jgi:hypothetical protein
LKKPGMVVFCLMWAVSPCSVVFTSAFVLDMSLLTSAWSQLWRDFGLGSQKSENPSRNAPTRVRQQETQQTAKTRSVGSSPGHCRPVEVLRCKSEQDYFTGRALFNPACSRKSHASPPLQSLHRVSASMLWRSW